MRIKPNIRILLFALIFLIGLSILLYPVVSNSWNQYLASKAMKAYDNKVEELEPAEINEAIEAARDYNDKLLPKAVPDAFSIREGISDTEYEKLLNTVGGGMMGYIEIPIIDVKSPIYHYTTEETLQKGVGHLFGSSLPIGGKGTHAVLTAHRGLPSNKLFSDLDKVVIGDKFFITICKETVAYQVDHIEVVEPDQTQGLALMDGKDYVTLVTCTPYGVNTHRILCRGHRIPYVPKEKDEIKPRAWVNMNLMFAIVGALFGILIALVLTIRMKKRGPIQIEEPQEKERKVIHLK